MALDAKQKVLIAIYTEYQKDKPNMESISPGSLGIDREIFNIAVDKLDNEGLINGVNIVRAGDSSAPHLVAIDYAKMSSYGIRYVEEKLGIKPELSGEEKVESVISSSTEWGWEQIKDIGSRVLAEMLKSQTGL
jgi:hypothetical protein